MAKKAGEGVTVDFSTYGGAFLITASPHGVIEWKRE